MCGWKVGGDYLSFNLFPRRPHRTVCAPQVTAPEGIPLLGALPRRGHEEGLSSGRRATGNPEAVGSAALFKDGGGGTSAAEAGAAWQRLGRYRPGEGRPAWARGGDAGWPVPEERPGVGRPVAKRADGPFLRHLPPSPSQWKEALSRPPAGRAGERAGRAHGLGSSPSLAPGAGPRPPRPAPSPLRAGAGRRAPGSPALPPRSLQSVPGVLRARLSAFSRADRARRGVELRRAAEHKGLGGPLGMLRAARGCERPQVCAPEGSSLRFR